MNILYILAILSIFAAIFSIIVGIIGGAYVTTMDILTRKQLSDVEGNVNLSNILINQLNTDDYKIKYTLNSMDASFIKDTQTSFIKYDDDTYMVTNKSYINMCDINDKCSKKNDDGTYVTKIMNVYGFSNPADKTKLLPIKISKY